MYLSEIIGSNDYMSVCHHTLNGDNFRGIYTYTYIYFSYDVF